MKKLAILLLLISLTTPAFADRNGSRHEEHNHRDGWGIYFVPESGPPVNCEVYYRQNREETICYYFDGSRRIFTSNNF